jgi:hypothetical protein
MSFIPFHDQGESITFGGLTLENGNVRIALYGQLDIRQDQESLNNLLALKEQIDSIITTLSGKHLPSHVASDEVTHAMKNPF